MKKKQLYKLYISLLVLLTMTVFSGCSTEDQISLSEEKIKPVKVLEVNQVTYPLTLEYLGIVASSNNNNPIVNVGLTQEDVDKVNIGQKTIVKANGKEVEGSILSIGDIPDPQTRTYNIEIELTESDFKIGTITDVTIVLEEKEGILIPISSILKNGDTYVYVIENDTVIKKEITLGDIKGSNIAVSGLNTGDKLVIEGANKLSVGDKVTIKQ